MRVVSSRSARENTHPDCAYHYVSPAVPWVHCCSTLREWRTPHIRDLPMRRAASLVLLSVLSTGCYHATITTGRPLSTTTIEQPWALSFIYGLVPPPTVETASKCPSGVAQVETMQSFLNGLVSGLTFGLFTPMTIKVTCAEGGRSAAPAIRSQGDAVKAISAAADMARERGTPVLVRF